MNDLIHSCSTPQEAVNRMTALDQVLAKGSFQIKEWYCSFQLKRTKVIEAPLVEIKEGTTQSHHQQGLRVKEVNLDGEREHIKTLRVGWNPSTDTLKFRVKDLRLNGKFTKRTVLSKISQIYDPLGLASAVTIRARVALQEIRKMKTFDWDDPLPEEMKNMWIKRFADIERLRHVEFPRCLKPSITTGPSELHVFAGASISGYGAVAYLLWPTQDIPEVRLVSAKARVVPLRQSTIPRLELMAALIALRLAKTIYEEFKVKPETVQFCSDSKMELHCLRSDSTCLKAFVGVRIAEIQSNWDQKNWRYVTTYQNPADDLSRGLPTEHLEARWMEGPSFLRRPKEEWPIESVQSVVEEDPEKKKSNLKQIGAVVPVNEVVSPIEYSNWQRLLRVTTCCMRFLSNVRKRIRRQASGDEPCDGPLVPEEIENKLFLHKDSSQTGKRATKI